VNGFYRILPERNLAYVRLSGSIDMDQVDRLFGKYQTDPLARPWMMQLVDLTGGNARRIDMIRVMALHARMAEVFINPEFELLGAWIAPDADAHHAAEMATRAWAGLPGVSTRIFPDAAGALAFLGQPETSVADLLQAAAR
jgi:hypothetical protein